MKKIRVLIADDHSVVRHGLNQILSKTSDLVVVEEAENGNEVLEKICKIDVDVILMDIEMPGKSGLETLMQLKNSNPKLPVLILSIFPEDHYGIRLLKAGAAGYLTKTSAPEQLVEAIRAVAQGGKFVSPHLAEKLVMDLDKDTDKPLHETLSGREFQVFCMIAAGKKLKDIADGLSVGITTVSTHRARILEKMNMKTNAELIHYALKNGLVS
ncbi:MAG: response regulator [Nitrospinales bacterium]